MPAFAHIMLNLSQMIIICNSMQQIWPQGYKLLFMLKLAEHEIILLKNVKMPTIVGIFSSINTAFESFKAINIFMFQRLS